MGEWTAHYQQGALIDFDFTKVLGLPDKVRQICQERGWEFREIEGDAGLLQRLLDGTWKEEEFLIVQPGQKVTASFDGGIIAAE